MISHCGLDCMSCPAYVATQENDDSKRTEIARQWSAQYNADIRPESVNCDGCCGQGQKFFYCSDLCKIRKCCLTKGLETCAGCETYPCAELEEVFSFAPHARSTLDEMRGKS